ncbi:hypothetical protein CTI12_AA397040 [Artemisia annua]|uniref:Uncharacterized protein n=1 Tax=Artemisia annua TaxID=35608 RepID=A0A2U1MBZ8_ARTAN|nr:hypothetical protein CTI12_AA397040 [Artemisia annua]
MTGFQSHVSKESERLSRTLTLKRFVKWVMVHLELFTTEKREDLRTEAIKLAELHHPNFGAFYGVVLSGPGGSVATKDKKKLCFNLMSQPMEVEIAKKAGAEDYTSSNMRHSVEHIEIESDSDRQFILHESAHGSSSPYKMTLSNDVLPVLRLYTGMYTWRGGGYLFSMHEILHNMVKCGYENVEKHTKGQGKKALVDVVALVVLLIYGRRNLQISNFYIRVSLQAIGDATESSSRRSKRSVQHNRPGSQILHTPMHVLVLLSPEMVPASMTLTVKIGATQPRVPVPAEGSARNVRRRVVTDMPLSNSAHGVASTREGSTFVHTEGQGESLLLKSYNFEFTKSVFALAVSIWI